MRHTWRWFGPHDLCRMEDIEQAGAVGVVSALHHVPNGAVWTPQEIATRQAEIAHRSDVSASPLRWDVVESLPVSEDIKKRKGKWRAHYDAYKVSLRNLAAAGIETVCYNFRSVLDWTRTDLRWRVPRARHAPSTTSPSSTSISSKRHGAAHDFDEAVVDEAARRIASMDDAIKKKLADSVTMGLPGPTESMDPFRVREHLAEYGPISPDRLREHFIDFLAEVVPVAEAVGIRMCCHPDAPPFPLLGLPRILSTAMDCAAMLDAVGSPANGLTLCSGSLGAARQ